MRKLSLLILLIISSFLIIGCGGGGDGLPDVDAARVTLGDDKSVNEQQQVVVSATASPTGGTFAWSYSGSANSETIEDFTSEGNLATFTAPASTEVQVFQITVKYTSLENKSATDSVKVTVNPINSIPLAVASLKSPAENLIAPGVAVVLTSIQSSDVDGTIETYKWQQIGGSPTIQPLAGDSSATFHFNAPQVETKSNFIFRLTITDNEQGTDDAEITITVDPTIITHQVLAGPDLTVNEEQTVTLSASAIPAGGTFFWTTTTGGLTDVFPSTKQSLSFVAPLTLVPTTHSFLVEYQAPDGVILHDSINVQVLPVNRLPVAAIRVTSPTLLPAKPGNIVTLDPSASYDPDGNGSIVKYTWQALGNAPAFSESANHELIFTAPATQYANSYVFQLTVEDNEGGKSSITQEIVVSGTEELNVANAGLDQSVKEFSTVTVSGKDSIIISGNTLVCSWRQIPTVAPTITLTNASSCQATFIAPPVDVATSIVLELTVNGPATDTVTIIILPLSLGTLNDTGIVSCYSSNAVSSCNNVNFPRQDAENGRDAYPGQIDKAGFSFNNNNDSFDFTKLDDNGDEMPITGSAASCVRDNVTGLIWEVKQGPGGSLRSNTNTYTWYYPDGSTGGNDGVEGVAGGTCPSVENCGLEIYVEEVNKSVYCGAANWRVPTLLELQSIVNYSQTSASGVIDVWAFNDLPLTGSPANVYFWTSETTAEGGGKASSWVIDFINGNDSVLPKGTPAYIRLVRNP